MTPLWLLLAALSGCLSATHQGHGRWAGSFAIDAPPSWEVTRNRRTLGHHLLVLQAPDDCCHITVERRRETRETRALPLSLLSDVMPLETGRIHGMVGEPVGHHQLDLGGREAWATTIIRHNGPNSWVVTSVFARSPDGLYVLTLDYPESAGPTVVRAWERVLTSFDLPDHPPPQVAPWEPEPFLDTPSPESSEEPA